MHKKVYQKETMMRVWSHNLPIIAHTALTNKMQISDSRAIIWCADHSSRLYSFRVMHEGEERRKNKKERKKRTESKFSCSIFSTVRRMNGTLGVYFAFEHLRCFICKSFISLCLFILEQHAYMYPKYRTPF